MKTNLFRGISVLALVIMLASSQISPAFGSARPAAGKPQVAEQSLESLLNPDGSLDLESGFQGSLDASDYSMLLDASGEPHFFQQDQAAPQAPAAAGDEWWDSQFMLGVLYSSIPGNSNVLAIAVNGSKVYMGGDFDFAGGVSAENVACWDSATHTWSALGGGVNSRVYAIAANGDDIYVGGHFTRAGGLQVNNIARWNATTRTWSALGSGMDMTTISSDVLAIGVAQNGDVYAAGQFDVAGGVAARNVARWDGSAWHALGGGVFDNASGDTTSEALSIAINGNDVYVGGEFDYAGGYSAPNVAHWDGNAWHAVGGGLRGLNASVEAIGISGSSIYFGGDFSEAHDGVGGNIPVNSVAMWNGAAWSDVGGGVTDGGADVYDIAVGPNGVYFGGRFLTAGGVAANRVARWDGSTWHALGETLLLLGGGVSSNVYSLAYSSADNSIYVGGFFDDAGSYLANQVARWSINASEWFALGNSVNGPVYAIAIAGDNVYVGGSFNSAGGVPVSGIARWNKTSRQWSDVGGGVNGCHGGFFGCTPVVYALVYYAGGSLYVGGNFTSAGGAPTNNIAIWNENTASWETLGDGVFGCSELFCSTYVRSICLSTYYGLIVGGRFDYAGSTANQANNIATWNGYYWDMLGNGTNGVVYAVANPSQWYVYIGGNFTSPSDYVASWDGSTWSSLNADTVNDVVYAIEPQGYHLYVGGAFTDLGGPNGDAITDFYSNAWHQLDGDGLNNTVYALDGSSWDELFAGGEFTASGILGLNYVARWYSTGSWSGYGSGTDNTVRAVAYDGHYLYVGGDFLNAGGKTSTYFGRWGEVYELHLPLVSR